MATLHAIILTFNEEKHIQRCIRSIAELCDSITVVDSGSTDQTVSLAEELGANVLHNEWVNYATQMNFAIKSISGVGGWILRIDADEVLHSSETVQLAELLETTNAEVDGLLVRRRIHFMGKRIRFGAIEPSFQLRIWRDGRGECEQRWMDEHIRVEGKIEKSSVILSDINLNSIDWWIQKHNSYASREAIDILNKDFEFLSQTSHKKIATNLQAKLRRFFKERIYRMVSRGIRPWIYFVYRYVFRLGFLDGKPGLYYHTLQGLWYRMLVDAKVDEITSYAEEHQLNIVEAIEVCTGFDPLAMTQGAAPST
ncbi:glycosyltransferase family 2 protein [Parvularcula sp. IMCC14364]|uniref:glycosyltransferase family 2 protein n=1 Tax=Parvularcula sp. IMCC14364 TaxID=3067902 RepID=UPI0027422D04|nr:glycosyltransferase family 2 protein [Parvularcula sp. IMCC14364]